MKLSANSRIYEMGIHIFFACNTFYVIIRVHYIVMDNSPIFVSLVK